MLLVHASMHATSSESWTNAKSHANCHVERNAHCTRHFARPSNHAYACLQFCLGTLHLIFTNLQTLKANFNPFQSTSDVGQSSIISPSHSSQNQQLQPFSQLQPSRQIQWSGPYSWLISSNVLFRRLGNSSTTAAWA